MIVDVYLGNFYGIQKSKDFYSHTRGSLGGPFGRVGRGGGAGGGELRFPVWFLPPGLLKNLFRPKAGIGGRPQNGQDCLRTEEIPYSILE